ncbi:Signal transduction histidine kinase [Catenovulum agarivorans DS-2]|uniref:histidine kinase n=1 Tax=Catenovulum agarivorans DS-2 TaxID=1328313 RepID=W7QWH4_9ALTE|nr:HAMP domain-containing sensor histidine kinase [Catenovulum agarivorans]EWH09615.1 Signal transduction histidine kinase [Catenovulum agarivorans DS-2]
MIKNTALQIRSTLVGTAFIAVFVLIYVIYVAIQFHIEHATKQSHFLVDYTERAITRIKTNPDKYLTAPHYPIGSDELQLVTSYTSLKASIPKVAEQSELTTNKITLAISNFRGVFSVAELILIYPIEFQQRTLYTYYRVTPQNQSLLDAMLAGRMQPAVFIAVVIIAIIFIVQLYYINHVNLTVRQLANWADNLSASKKVDPPPKLKVDGLTSLAYTVNNSINKFTELLEKEHSFARFTSHELRTQVAVLSTNMEILEAMMRDLSPDERRVLQRMEIAVADMKYQIEALLWISREGQNNTGFSSCEPAKMIEKSIEDNQSIIEGKNVRLIVSGDALCVNTHPTLLQIVLNNLVRNAFQNTLQGLVHIAVMRNGLTILNQNTVENKLVQQHKEPGFGIGLVLIEKIVNKINLSYEVETFENGRSVSLTFPEKDIENNHSSTNVVNIPNRKHS